MKYRLYVSQSPAGMGAIWMWLGDFPTVKAARNASLSLGFRRFAASVVDVKTGKVVI